MLVATSSHIGSDTLLTLLSMTIMLFKSFPSLLLIPIQVLLRLLALLTHTAAVAAAAAAAAAHIAALLPRTNRMVAVVLSTLVMVVAGPHATSGMSVVCVRKLIMASQTANHSCLRQARIAVLVVGLVVLRVPLPPNEGVGWM
jgi:hypothetical protein